MSTRLVETGLYTGVGGRTAYTPETTHAVNRLNTNE